MAPAGGALPQSRTLFGGRGLSERSACPACPACPERSEGTKRRGLAKELREGTLTQQPTAWKSRSFASLRMTTERHFLGPRPGANGFGSFCRNKRTSSCGDETPQEPLPFCHSRKFLAGIQGRYLCFCLSSPTPIGDPVSFSSRMKKAKTLDPRLQASRMTEENH